MGYCSVAQRPPRIYVAVRAINAKMIVVNTTVGQNLELSAPLPDRDNAWLWDGPVSVIALAIRVMPVAGVNSPAPCVPAEFLAREVLCGDRPALAKIRVGKGRTPGRNAGNGCAQQEWTPKCLHALAPSLPPVSRKGGSGPFARN
jgi:hypothetical protein